MNTLDISIKIYELSNYNKSLREELGDRELLKMIREFSKYILRLYIFLITEEINSNRYKGEWEPKDDEEYQKYLGVVPKGNLLEYLEESLECRKVGYKFVIRVNPKSKYPGSNIPLTKVLKAVEYGTSKFNARPILVRVKRTISDNMIDLWRGFLTMKGVI